MKKYKLFNKQASVAEVLQEDSSSDIFAGWQEKAERLQKKRWGKVRFHHQMLVKAKKQRHHSLRSFKTGTRRLTSGGNNLLRSQAY